MLLFSSIYIQNLSYANGLALARKVAGLPRLKYVWSRVEAAYAMEASVLVFFKKKWESASDIQQQLISSESFHQGK